jgi:hypothetical protein
MKRVFFCFIQFLFALRSLSFAEESKSMGDTKLSSQPDLPWLAEYPQCFSDDNKTLTLIGSTYEQSDLYWEKAAKAILKFQHRDKVTTLCFNQGYISGASLRCLSGFVNVDTIRLGWVIEGVTIPPKDLVNILCFKKLKNLNVALHSLSEDHLKVIAQLDSVTDLHIEFPTVHMIQTDRLQKGIWKPMDLGDEAAQPLSKLKSLESLVIGGVPNAEDGKVAFSE